MRRIATYSALLLTLVSCNDGASSPTAVAAPHPPPYLSTFLLGGTWTGTALATGYSTENYIGSSEGLACLEARLSLQQGLVRAVEASFVLRRDFIDFIDGTFQLEPDWTLAGDFRDLPRTSFIIFPLFLRNSSSSRVCEAQRSYSTRVRISEMQLATQGDANPPNRLTGELSIRYEYISNDGESRGGYVEQTNSITLSR